ncbi:PREDICTED: SMC5-SMC6 complex localization factor protein 2-like [Calidris pugnax]|uniref:SMC5-SMC6 complex localization factor protein 2-like n=1 Tax=Calidris pugnax TaxID=198806 RepID=UPI00071CB2DB|nr:PREDICTED: SMC5-SMC6 complex localization factor protein 2-like [Calidris pugnax]
MSCWALSKPPVVSQVSYVNSLENLLKEKAESKRVDELEKQLQEDIQRRETDSLDGHDEENAHGDEDLSEEHRAFIKKFSVIADAIPDYHPGEDIFDLSTSGKIFSQHNLDLRNFHFIPQNPIEKLLLRYNLMNPKGTGSAARVAPGLQPLGQMIHYTSLCKQWVDPSWISGSHTAPIPGLRSHGSTPPPPPPPPPPPNLSCSKA